MLLTPSSTKKFLLWYRRCPCSYHSKQSLMMKNAVLPLSVFQEGHGIKDVPSSVNQLLLVTHGIVRPVNIPLNDAELQKCTLLLKNWKYLLMKHGKTLNSKKHQNYLIRKTLKFESLFLSYELKIKRLRDFSTSFPSIHPEGNRTPSQEPESYVISITLRVATVIVYQILWEFGWVKREWDRNR